MKAVLLFLTFVSIACINAQGIAPVSDSPLVQSTRTHAKGGVITAVGEKFFQNFKDIILKRFVENVSNFEIPVLSKVIPAGKIFDLNITAHNFRLTHASVDIADTELVIQKKDPQIYAKLEDVQFVFDFDYNITTDPEFVQDIGHAQVIIQNLTGEMAGDPVVTFDSDQQRPAYNIDIQMAKFSCDNFTLDMDGGDVAELVNGFSGISAGFLREFILTSFNEPMRHALAGLINKFLAPRDLVQDFTIQENAHLTLNYSLVDEGVHVSDSFVSAVFDASFHPANSTHGEKTHVNDFNNLPFYEKRGRDLQVMVSEHTINSLLISVVELNVIKFDMNFTSDQIQSIIADFEVPFGEQDDVLMEFKATPLENLHQKYHPVVEITKDEVFFKFRGDIHIKNPYDTSIDAMVLTVQLKTYVKFSVNEQFKLFCEAEWTDVEFVDMKSYFRTGATLKNLNDRLEFVAPIAVGYVNSLFVKGITLPLNQNVTNFLKDPRARHFDGYLFLDAEPDFSTLDVFENLEKLGFKNSTFHEVVDLDDQIDKKKLLTF